MHDEKSIGLWFGAALLPEGWASDVRVEFAGGLISSVEAGVPARPDDARQAIGIPGLSNLHSHAFQRAMAALAEAPAGGGHDDFWSWREGMYALLARLTPDDAEAVAAMAFVEMLEGGFTRTGEFHYLHNQPSGAPYADRSEMASALASASEIAGIGLTLLPVFYAHANFGGTAPTAAQKRFVTGLGDFADLLDGCRRIVARLEGGVLGVAPHSLRAVTPEELRALLTLAPEGPVHIHIAEQVREVDACLAWSGQRPVEWLLDHERVDDRWCLVHATHIDTGELQRVARSGAVVGLCPITEANLGDGIFPAADFAALGGCFGVGSDSNVLIDAAEELRLLEYSQRLALKRRNVLATSGRSTGRTLYEAALTGGARALGAYQPAIEVGAPADIVALAADDVLGSAPDDRQVDRWVFSRGRDAIDAVWRAGRLVVRGGRHLARAEVERRYRMVAKQLFA